MSPLFIDGAEYASSDATVAIYSSESGCILATVGKPPAGLLTYSLYERTEDIYYGSRWELPAKPASLFKCVKDAEKHIAIAVARLNTKIRSQIDDQYADFRIRNA